MDQNSTEFGVQLLQGLDYSYTLQTDELCLLVASEETVELFPSTECGVRIPSPFPDCETLTRLPAAQTVNTLQNSCLQCANVEEPVLNCPPTTPARYRRTTPR